MTPDPTNRNEQILLDGVTAATDGEPFYTPGADAVTILTVVSGVSTGATRVLETLDPDGNWNEFDSSATTASDIEEPVIWIGPVKAVRARITGYTDGTYTVSAIYK